MLTLKTKLPKDFGRILKDEEGRITSIVENSDANAQQKTIDEYNTGVYCFEKDLVFEAIMHIDNNNSQAEYYLTDTIEYLVRNGHPVQAIQTKDANEILGINSPDDLNQAERLLVDHHRLS